MSMTAWTVAGGELSWTSLYVASLILVNRSTNSRCPKIFFIVQAPIGVLSRNSHELGSKLICSVGVSNVGSIIRSSLAA